MRLLLFNHIEKQLVSYQSYCLIFLHFMLLLLNNSIIFAVLFGDVISEEWGRDPR
jgi:hypothetical protein